MSKPVIFLFISIWIAVAVVACVADENAEVPARPSGPHFTHKDHLDRGLGCSDCHGGEEASFKAMPDQDTCMACHEDIDEDLPADRRAAAFFGDDGKGRWIHAGRQSSEINFSHESHAQDEESCVRCHEWVMSSSFIPETAGLSMDTCLSCHEKEVPGYTTCDVCHKEIRKDRRPPSHQLGWKVKHGRMARMGDLDLLPRDCSICHTPDSCDMCHRAEVPRSHNNLWRLRGHAAMASMDRDRCAVCHKTDSCAACHQRTPPRSHRGAWGGPFQRHCNSCHLPLGGFGEEGCALCHRGGTPGHDAAPVRPGNPAHMTTNPDDCRACHTPLPHPDNGQSCLFCHR